MSQLVITKALAKNGKDTSKSPPVLSFRSLNFLLTRSIDYTGKQAHVELAERMKQRDAGTSNKILRCVCLLNHIKVLRRPWGIGLLMLLLKASKVFQ